MPFPVTVGQQCTAFCPPGRTGTPVTVMIPAGTIMPNANNGPEANAQAAAKACSDAYAQLVCTTPPGSQSVTFTANYNNACDDDVQCNLQITWDFGVASPGDYAYFILMPSGYTQAISGSGSYSEVITLPPGVTMIGWQVNYTSDNGDLSGTVTLTPITP